MPPRIAPLEAGECAAIWPLIAAVAREGTSYPLPRDLTCAQAARIWAEPGRRSYVAWQGASAVGTYYLRPNGLGPNAHVANAGYIVAEAARGRGIARALFAHSLAEARAQAYRILQFNLVVSTNRAAVHLWTALGMTIVGTLPKVFDHPVHGPVDAHVMVLDLGAP